MSISAIGRAGAIAALSFIAISAGVLTGCGETRTQRFSYVKKNVPQGQMLRDEKDLRNTSGVEDVILRPDADGTVYLQLFVVEENRAKAMNKATELGYEPIRN